MFRCSTVGSTPSPPPTSPGPTWTTCQNGGTYLGNNTCYCPFFFTGQYCQIPICLNGGTMTSTGCICPPGYEDQYCQTSKPTNKHNFNQFSLHTTLLVYSNLRPASVIQFQHRPKDYGVYCFDSKLHADGYFWDPNCCTTNYEHHQSVVHSKLFADDIHGLYRSNSWQL